MDPQKNDACEFQQSQSIGSAGEFKLSKIAGIVFLALPAAK
jgi:hypothetical protein